MEKMLQQPQQTFEAEYEVYQAQPEKLQKVQKLDPQTGRVAEMDQRPVQVGMTTAHSVARPTDSEMDPTPNSFQGIDLEDTEDHNRVEGKIDNTVDQKVVGNLELGTDFEVDNLEARTESGVDLEVYIDTGVDIEVCTESRVDLEVCTILISNTIILICIII